MARILVGVTGGVAAFKIPHLLRLLRRSGHEVKVIATPEALRFITPLSLATAAGNEVFTEERWFAPQGEILHVDLARWADLVVIAPATAEALGRAAQGAASDLLSATLLAGAPPPLWAPAMNPEMWRHPALQHHVNTLKSWGHRFVGPEWGALASLSEGQGEGRMSEPEEIFEHIQHLLQVKDLAGYRLLISAGPTREYLDPVRFLSNPASGRTGYALAQAARDRGAEVTLVSGPTSLKAPWGIELVQVESALEMYEALLAAYPAAHAVIMTAAVADYRAAQPSAHKEHKTGTSRTLELIPNPDILEALGAQKGSRILIGFAMETEEGEERARSKLKRKHLDLIALNYPRRPGLGFGDQDNQLTLLYADGRREELPPMSKDRIAQELLDRLKQLLS